MRVGMIGMGRMGAAMAERLIRAGYEVVAYDVRPEAGEVARRVGAGVAGTIADLGAALDPPRVAWIMLPAAVVEVILAQLAPLLRPGDVIVDSGNSYYGDDIRRAAVLGAAGLGFADVAELWRRGSVIGSFLLDLIARALVEGPDLARFRGGVADSGEGRWAVQAAIDEGVPAPVLGAALHERFASRTERELADRVISAMRSAFGGHPEPAA